jgi:hypothetical protein
VKPFKAQIVWRNVINISLLHIFSFYGAYLAVTQAQTATLIDFGLTNHSKRTGLCGHFL